MFKDFIKQDAALTIYPLVSLVVFVLFFILLLISVWRKNQNHYDHLSQMPLDETKDSIKEITKQL
jgi:cbb3-type cytochrome oxidase subunit 3